MSERRDKAIELYAFAGGRHTRPITRNEQMSDPLKPSITLLVKLGSIAVHLDELLSPSGHIFDRHALKTLFEDKEVKEWLAQMSKLAMLPVKR